MFKNKKKRALIGLIFWVLLISIIYIGIYQDTKRKERSYNEIFKKYDVIVDYENLKDALLNNEYAYKYIVLDDKLYLYEGTYDKNTIFNNKYKYLNLNKVFSMFDDVTFENGMYIFENDNIYVKIRVTIDNIIYMEINDDDIIYQLKMYNIKNFQVKGSDE